MATGSAADRWIGANVRPRYVANTGEGSAPGWYITLPDGQELPWAFTRPLDVAESETDWMVGGGAWRGGTHLAAGWGRTQDDGIYRAPQLDIGADGTIEGVEWIRVERSQNNGLLQYGVPLLIGAFAGGFDPFSVGAASSTGAAGGGLEIAADGWTVGAGESLGGGYSFANLTAAAPSVAGSALVDAAIAKPAAAAASSVLGPTVTGALGSAATAALGTAVTGLVADALAPSAGSGSAQQLQPGTAEPGAPALSRTQALLVMAGVVALVWYAYKD
jgi:hypothetical protein